VSLDGQVAPLGHGITGVDRQVQDHLFDLGRVGEGATQPRVETVVR
jgi:hypothetical protein